LLGAVGQLLVDLMGPSRRGNLWYLTTDEVAACRIDHPLVSKRRVSLWGPAACPRPPEPGGLLFGRSLRFIHGCVELGISMNHLVDIDFTGIDSQDQLHELLDNAFGFPNFHGGNFHALVDCLSSLRSPEDGMSRLVLNDPSDTLTIRSKGLTTMDRDSLFVLVGAMECVNEREMRNGNSMMLSLLPT
jgi:hypothetical protein